MTMVVQVLCKSKELPLQNNNVKRSNLAISGARERRRISDLPLCSISGFEIVWTARNQLNDFRVLRDSLVKYKFLNLLINSVDTTKIPCYTLPSKFFGTNPVQR